MDIQLILGPNNSGKSLFAENLCVQEKEAPLFYLATMVSQNEENEQRIEKHRLQRAGKGFTTIEEPWDIHTLALPQDAVVLLEDASNLLANGIFIHHSNVNEAFERILTLANKCQKLIIVNISGLAEGDYDEETNSYIRQMNLLNQLLEEASANCFRFELQE